MKTVHLKISEHLYSKLKELLDSFPKGSYEIIDDDPDTLSLEEEEEIYRSKSKTEKNDFSEFEDWEDIKKKM